MAAEQHGVLQNREAMPQQSFLLTQKSEYNGILLKQLRQRLRQALWLDRRSAGC
jgi:hypothetical protein